MAYSLDWFRSTLESFWGDGRGIIWLLLVAVGLTIGFCARQDATKLSVGGIPVTAKITYISVGASKYRKGLNALIVAQDHKGHVGQTSIPYDIIAGCKIGDKIKAIRSGLVLILEPANCR